MVAPVHLALAQVSAVSAVSASIDAGFASLTYDGFQTATATSLAPVLRFSARSFSLDARGSMLAFETGSRSVQGVLSGAWVSQPFFSATRLELSATGGVSGYRRFREDSTAEPQFRPRYNRFSHGLGRARIHWSADNTGAWLGAGAGRLDYLASTRRANEVGWGVWWRRHGQRAEATLIASGVGDTSYTDATSTLHLQHGRLLAYAMLGSRFSSRGGGHGVYGEASAGWKIGRGLSVMASGGRYPSDPTRGSIAGRYGALALRFEHSRPAYVAPPERVQAGASAEHATVATRAIEIRTISGMRRLLRLRAPSATRVELMADFNDWRPVSLTRAGDGWWELELQAPAGAHRLNVRIDGGGWIVPEGLPSMADDFGGTSGLIVLP